MSRNTSSINGPEESWDPLTLLDADSLHKLVNDDDNNTNKNNNKNSNINSKQDIFMKTDCVSEASGSSFIEIGNTKLLVSCYGPREIARKDEYDFKISNLNVEFRFASFSCFMQRKATLAQRDQGPDEKNFSTVIEEGLKPSILLHKYPKSQIDLYILCLQNDLDSRNIISASIMASSLALANASIELYDLVASHTYLPVALSVSYMPQLHQITSVYFCNETNGVCLSTDLYKSHVKESVENCKKIYAYMKLILVGGGDKKNKKGENAKDSDADENDEELEERSMEKLKIES